MKSQAETAGRLSSSSSAQPQKGTVLRDVDLLLPDGTRRLLSAIRGQANLVMLFTAGQDYRALLNHLISFSPTLKEHSTRVLVVRLGPEQAGAVPAAVADALVITSDPSGAVHRILGATDAARNPIPTIYITDRFGEVFAAFRAHDLAALPRPQEMIPWLEFINYQCEECSPPEWQE